MRSRTTGTIIWGRRGWRRGCLLLGFRVKKWSRRAMNKVEKRREQVLVAKMWRIQRYQKPSLMISLISLMRVLPLWSGSPNFLSLVVMVRYKNKSVYAMIKVIEIKLTFVYEDSFWSNLELFWVTYIFHLHKWVKWIQNLEKPRKLWINEWWMLYSQG